MELAVDKFLKVFTNFFGEKTDAIDQISKVTFNGRELFEFCCGIATIDLKIEGFNHNERVELTRIILAEIKAVCDQRRAVMENVKQTFTADNIKTLVDYYAKKLKLLQEVLNKVKIS